MTSALLVAQRTDRRPVPPRPRPTAAEVDAHLTAHPLCRLALVSGGNLINGPLWFVWCRPDLWVSIRANRPRWRALHDGPRRGPRAAAVVDDGHRPGQVAGVELHGRLRLAEPDPAVVRLFTDRYHTPPDLRYTWARLTARDIYAWRS